MIEQTIRAKPLVSPASRAKITREVIQGPDHRWTGNRRGVHMQVALTDQPTLENFRIVYCASFRRHRIKGAAGTVYDALEKIQSDVDKIKEQGK